MSQIPPSHKLANRAVLAVSSVLAEVGALAEHVKNDYGEDVIVQTSLGDSADNFTLLIQVKGTQRALNADGVLSISFDVQHLYRWASHSQPVLVCVYSEPSKRLHAFSPRHSVSLWEMSTSRYKSKTIRLGAAHEFSADTANRFIWDCRIEHYGRMLAWRESHLAYAAGSNEFARRRNYAERELSLICFRFLQDVGVLVGDDVLREFRQKVENASRSFARERAPGASGNLRPVDAIGLALLGHVDEISGGSGLPAVVLERCSRVASIFFKNRHPEEWQRIESCFVASDLETEV